MTYIGQPLGKRKAANGMNLGLVSSKYRASSTAPWKLYKPLEGKTPEINAQIEKATYSCVLCGNVAHYRVGMQGFCREKHQAEAWAAQAVYYQKIESKKYRGIS